MEVSVIVDGWNYDMRAAPRSLDVEIIVVVKDRDNAWTRHGISGSAIAVSYDDGRYNPESEGWTTGGCRRWDDDVFACWRLLPPDR